MLDAFIHCACTEHLLGTVSREGDIAVNKRAKMPVLKAFTSFFLNGYVTLLLVRASPELMVHLFRDPSGAGL